MLHIRKGLVQSISLNSATKRTYIVELAYRGDDVNYMTLGKNLEFDEPYHAWAMTSLDSVKRCAVDWCGCVYLTVCGLRLQHGCHEQDSLLSSCDDT